MRVSTLTVFALCVGGSIALQNGLARTPPMGWLSWERFRCITDCATYPDSCISEQLYMAHADRMVADGWLAAGYNLVAVDDCWQLPQRNATTGQQQPDPTRFPSGMAALAKYVHARGLKFQIYSDVGTATCEGLPGSLGHFDIDAKTYASWGVDSVKLDGCNANVTDFRKLYTEFGRALARTGRPILYACSWPAYIDIGSTQLANFSEIAQVCNLWRAYDDVQDSSSSLYSIMRWWGGKAGTAMAKASGPGGWSDADMLIGGDFGLSFSEAQMQFGLWAVIASPLFLGNDLRRIDPQVAAMLQNPAVIAISQDSLGRQGTIVAALSNNDVQWWTRPLANGDLAVFAACISDDQGTFFFSNATLSALGWPHQSAHVFDTYAQKPLAMVTGVLSLTLAPNLSQLVRLHH